MNTKSITTLAVVGVLVLVAAAALVACGDEGAGTSAGATASGGGPGATPGGAGATSNPTGGSGYDIAGKVQRLTVDTSVSAQEQGILGAMLIVAPEGDTTSAYDKASVAIASDTKIWRTVGEGVETLEIDDLAEGDSVIVVFTGPVAESYPVQATAASIEVVTGID